MPRYVKYVSASEAADIISKKLNIELFELVDILSEVPAADVQDVQYSSWIKSDGCNLVPTDDGKFECSHEFSCMNCGWSFFSAKEAGLKHCPECGVKMKDENNIEE